jgi:hypothetical protein
LFDDNNAALLAKLLELVNEINTLKTTLTSSTVGDSGAKNLGVAPIAGLDTTNLQVTLETLKNDINSIVFNNLPSASITIDKLAFTPITSQTDFNQNDLSNVYFNYIKTVDPTSSDNVASGFKVGDKWTNTTGKTYWRCIGDGIWEADDTLSTAVATLFGLVGSNATMRNAMSMAVPNASYMIFCSSTNAVALDAAFGKNNTDRVGGVGLQMAMYSWFKGDSKTIHPFTNTQQQQKLTDILALPVAYNEVRANQNMIELISLSTYASDLANTIIPMAGTIPAYQCGSTFSYQSGTTTGTAYSSVTITRSGIYTVKATVSDFQDYSAITAVVRKNNVSLGTCKNIYFSQNLYLATGDVLDIYIVSTNANSKCHISPILLFTRRPLVLPSTVTDGLRVVQATTDSVNSTALTGTSLTFDPITKDGTYRINFVWGGGTEAGTSGRTISINKNGSPIYTESYSAYSYGHVVSQASTFAVGDVISITWTGTNSGRIVVVSATLSITSNDNFPA